MVFEKINGHTMVLDTIKHYPVLLKKLLALFPLNMVAHLLIALLVKVDIQKKFLVIKILK